MSGFNLSLGVGLKYIRPLQNRNRVVPPEPSIFDAIMLEDGIGAIFLEDGSYFQIEDVSVASVSKASKDETINSDYWNF